MNTDNPQTYLEYTVNVKGLHTLSNQLEIQVGGCRLVGLLLLLALPCTGQLLFATASTSSSNRPTSLHPPTYISNKLDSVCSPLMVTFENFQVDYWSRRQNIISPGADHLVFGQKSETITLADLAIFFLGRACGSQSQNNGCCQKKVHSTSKRNN